MTDLLLSSSTSSSQIILRENQDAAMQSTMRITHPMSTPVFAWYLRHSFHRSVKMFSHRTCNVSHLYQAKSLNQERSEIWAIISSATVETSLLISTKSVTSNLVEDGPFPMSTPKLRTTTFQLRFCRQATQIAFFSSLGQL